MGFLVAFNVSPVYHGWKVLTAIPNRSGCVHIVLWEEHHDHGQEHVPQTVVDHSSGAVTNVLPPTLVHLHPYQPAITPEPPPLAMKPGLRTLLWLMTSQEAT